MCENVTICEGSVLVVMIYSKSRLLCRKGKCVLNTFAAHLKKNVCTHFLNVVVVLLENELC